MGEPGPSQGGGHRAKGAVGRGGHSRVLTGGTVLLCLVPHREDPLQVPRDTLREDRGIFLDVLDEWQPQSLQKPGGSVPTPQKPVTFLHPTGNAHPGADRHRTRTRSRCPHPSTRQGIPHGQPGTKSPHLWKAQRGWAWAAWTGAQHEASSRAQLGGH